MTFRPATGAQILFTTAFASAILLAMGIFFLVLGQQYRGRGGIHYVFLLSGCLLLALLMGSLNFRVRSYEINSGKLTIHAGLSSKVFPLANLQDARLEERPFAGCRRDLGVGGFWSNYGTFTSPRWGKFLAYASDSSRGVLLVWPDKKLLVTPVDASTFIQTVKSSK